MNSSGELEVSVGDVVDVTLDLVEDGYGETILSEKKQREKKSGQHLRAFSIIKKLSLEKFVEK